MRSPKLCLTLALGCLGASGQQLRSLKTVSIPDVPDLDDFVRDRGALVALGKIFFWDMQAGSDGRTACASCHFHAGADHRPQNQIVDPNSPFAVNLQLASVSFPLRMLSDATNRNSQVLWDTGMRVGSAGTFRRIFEDIVPGQAAEMGKDALDKPEFMLGGLQVRRVTVRNSPSVINAVFSVRSFWDGRAQRTFNGFTPSGNTADAPGVLVWRDGVLTRQQVRLDNSSLASQSTGPALDHLEMSYAGRTWPKFGKKLLSLPPLALQRVAIDDGVLGAMARADARGLDDGITYLSLLKSAFQPALWESNQLVDADGAVLPGRTGGATNTAEFTQAEYNFSLFWGLALQAYQSTLVSADSRFDRFQDGDASALTAEEQEGLRLFQTTGRCNTCHAGAEFSGASFTATGNGGRGNRSFQRTGVRPIAEDTGAGNGSFKSIGLRNIEFTGPYFHNGGQSTLEQVIDFYVRGGDFNPTNNTRPINNKGEQKAAIVAFLKTLSDDRVRYERAPFDHPELCVPVGHVESAPGVLTPGEPGPFALSAAEKWRAIPAIGSGGNQVPLRTFDELLRGAGGNGARSHLLDQACTVPLP